MGSTELISDSLPSARPRHQNRPNATACSARGNRLFLPGSARSGPGERHAVCSTPTATITWTCTTTSPVSVTVTRYVAERGVPAADHTEHQHSLSTTVDPRLQRATACRPCRPSWGHVMYTCYRFGGPTTWRCGWRGYYTGNDGIIVHGQRLTTGSEAPAVSSILPVTWYRSSVGAQCA